MSEIFPLKPLFDEATSNGALCVYHRDGHIYRFLPGEFRLLNCLLSEDSEIAETARAAATRGRRDDN